MLGVDKTHGLWQPLLLILLSKIEGNYTFNATNLHQNALKNYLNLSQIYCVTLDRSRTVKKTHRSKKSGFELARVKRPL